MSMSTEPQESPGSLADAAPKQAADGDALVVQKQQIHQRRDVMLGMSRHHTVDLLTCRQRACPMMHHIVLDFIKRDCVGKPHRVTYIVSTIPVKPRSTVHCFPLHQMSTLLHLISDQINLDARTPIHILARPHTKLQLASIRARLATALQQV